MLPTRLTFARPLHLLSPQSMALKKRSMRSCLPWMSQWQHTSTRPLSLYGKCRSLTLPNCAEQHLPSLNELTPLPGKQPKLCTPRLCSRSFRPNFSKRRMSLDPILQLSESCVVQQITTLRAAKVTAQTIGRSMVSLVVLERHLWINLTKIKEACSKTAPSCACSKTVPSCGCS